nr:hypothetical protein [Bifidobacterium bifidum]
DAKQSALDGMEYTGEHVNILYEDGYVCTTARWFGVEPEEDDEGLVQFGDYGFYQIWNDDLG